MLAKLFKYIAVTTAIATTAAVSLYTVNYFFPTYKIEGISMLPSIQPGHSYSSIALWDEVNRHDIFAITSDKLTYPGGKTADAPYVKRIIGIPGDKLIFNTNSGQLVKLNGIAVDTKPDKQLVSFSLTSKLAKSKGSVIWSHPYVVSFAKKAYSVYEPDKKAFANEAKIKSYSSVIFNYPFLKEQSNGELFTTIDIPSGYYFALSDNRTAGIDSRHFGLVPEGSLKNKFTSKGL